MTFGVRFGFCALALCLTASGGFAVEPASAPASAPTQSADALPMVPSAGPGIFVAQKKGAAGYRLTVTGHKFTSRDDIEKYLAYRAAELTMAQKASWFTLSEARTKGDTAVMPKRDLGGAQFIRHAIQNAAPQA